MIELRKLLDEGDKIGNDFIDKLFHIRIEAVKNGDKATEIMANLLVDTIGIFLYKMEEQRELANDKCLLDQADGPR